MKKIQFYYETGCNAIDLFSEYVALNSLSFCDFCVFVFFCNFGILFGGPLGTKVSLGAEKLATFAPTGSRDVPEPPFWSIWD